MKTKSFALAVITAILLPCIVARGQTEEVTVEGHTLSVWIGRTNDPKFEVRRNAAMVIHDMGPGAKAAVPCLSGYWATRRVVYETGRRER